MRITGFSLLLLQVTFVCTEYVSYANYKVYTVLEEGEGIPALRSNLRRFSVLTERNLHDSKDHPLTLKSYLVPENKEKAFRSILNRARANYNVSVSDLGKDIEEERRSIEQSGRRFSSELGFVGETYYSYHEMVWFLDELGKVTHPSGEPLALVDVIGHTFEGRPMHLVRISSDHSANRPIIFFEAGIHAREWTAPASVLYMMYQLVHNYTHNADVLKDVDFYVIPLSNPDGYEYSRTTDRLWRKTRSVNGVNFGVDGNRNFDFHWGEEGTSKSPHSDIYIGPYPFSERETRSIRDTGMKYLDRINVFVSVHAYGPYIVYPWSLKKMGVPPQVRLMEEVGLEAAKAIRHFNGTHYIVGSSADVLYEAAGGADDYFKGVLGVDLSYTVELSPGPKGTFITPAHYLLGVVAEAYEGFKVMSKHAAKYQKKRKGGERGERKQI